MILVLSRTQHGTAYRHKAGRAELREREHRHFVVFAQRHGINRGPGQITQRGANLLARGIGAQSRDNHAAEIGIGFEPAGALQRVRERCVRGDPLRARLPDIALYRDATSHAGGHARHVHDVTAFQSDGRPGVRIALVGNCHVQDNAVAAFRRPLGRWHNAFNTHIAPRGIIGEPPGRRDQIIQRFAVAQLVGGGTQHTTVNAYPRAVRWHKQHIAILEPDIAGRVTANQVVVDIKLLRCGTATANFDGAQGPAIRRTACRVEGGQRGACAGDAIAAWLLHVTYDKHLVRTQSRHAEREPRGVAKSRVHAGQSFAQHAVQLSQRE